MKPILALAALLLATFVATAGAHDLTCSSSHRNDLKRYGQLVVDDMPGSQCVGITRNQVRFVACRGRTSYRQDVWKTAEKTYLWPNSPFYHAVSYTISGVRYGDYC